MTGKGKGRSKGKGSAELEGAASHLTAAKKRGAKVGHPAGFQAAGKSIAAEKLGALRAIWAVLGSFAGAQDDTSQRKTLSKMVTLSTKDDALEKDDALGEVKGEDGRKGEGL